jgi:hypothetical protein
MAAVNPPLNNDTCAPTTVKNMAAFHHMVAAWLKVAASSNTAACIKVAVHGRTLVKSTHEGYRMAAALPTRQDTCALDHGKEHTVTLPLRLRTTKVVAPMHAAARASRYRISNTVAHTPEGLMAAACAHRAHVLPACPSNGQR